jgi:hypothetical protein
LLHKARLKTKTRRTKKNKDFLFIRDLNKKKLQYKKKGEENKRNEKQI